MQTFNNDIQIHRNETFCIDKLLINRDGSPFIVSGEISNPYWLLTISSIVGKPTAEDGFNYSIWLPIDTTRFVDTNYVDLELFTVSDDSDVKAYPDGYEDVPIVQGEPVVNGYINGEYVISNSNSVFKFKNDYKYYENNSWIDYKCKITAYIGKHITSLLKGKNYWYTVQLVSSSYTTGEYLTNICEVNHIRHTGYNEQQMYEAIIAKDKSLLPDNFDLAAPIQLIDTCIPILGPCKITVVSNLQGGLN